MARVFLIDGSALAFRSHFAFQRTGLATADGRPTGATYGFTLALRQLLAEQAPDRIAIAFDHKGKTFRHERFPDYKATRERAPEDLVAQLGGIRDVARAHGITIFEVPGYEADDVIGTLARAGEAAGDEVFIVSGDKDFMQLVSEHVKLLNIFKAGEPAVVQDAAAVAEKFGTTPDHVVDVLALMGDSSDNVPGVKGIGEKGAIKLIGDYGSVDGLLEHLDDLTPKQREKIEADRENLLLSRELVTIDTGVPLDPGYASVAPAEPDEGRLRELFKALEFKSLLGQLDAGGARATERDYVTVADLDGLAAMERELRAAGRFAVDSETTSLRPLEARIVGLSFSARAGRAFYVPFNADPPVDPAGPEALLERLRPLLTDPDLERCAQNAKYDWLVLAGKGVDVPPPAFDTMVASFCIAGSTRAHNLDALALHYFDLTKIPTKELIGSGAKQITMAEVPVETVAEYACEDADVTWRLVEVLEPELDEAEARDLFETLELPLVPVLTRMEQHGIAIDTELLARMSKELALAMQAAEDRVHELAGEVFNVASTKALGQVLFEKLEIHRAAGVKSPKRTKTGYSTDAATLEQYYGDVEIVRELLRYRELAKLQSTYVEALPRFVNPDTGRIHCSFSQVAAATGRLASSDPNLQNIPVRTERGRRLREAFVPRGPRGGETGWVFLAADYSQIELRVMAHLSGDELLQQAFAEGRDIHASTAAVIFDVDPDAVDRTMRSQAKVINFGLLYGMGPQRVARETGMSVAEARDFIDKYFASFPTVKDWMERTLTEARSKGYVETLLGRRRRIPDLSSGNQRVRAMAENAALNTPVQGSAADIIKRAMIDLDARLRATESPARMLLQVHDELLLEVPEGSIEETRALVVDCMEHAVQLDVPLVVDVGTGHNWLEAH